MQLVTVRRAQVVQMLFVITFNAADEPQSAPIYSTPIHDQPWQMDCFSHIVSLSIRQLLPITIYYCRHLYPALLIK